ncbi:MAG: hypothetical protein M3R58_15060 [Pseudomonadota bacterium]|nr:hypothetical protein [Pseudomonadota bacterium]
MRSAHLLAGSILAAMAPLAASQSNGDEQFLKQYAVTVAKVAAGFVNLAGSEDNAVALVEALYHAQPVQLVWPSVMPESSLPSIITIEPPTAPMDWDDVRLALILARDALASVGILRPAGEQLRAAFMGGEFVAPSGRLVGLRGVLQMRADGFNWGRIASERFQRPAVARIE